MAIDNRTVDNIRSFWNNRAGFGLWAGTRDINAKLIEIENIALYVRDGMRVLDIGCGNGVTAIELAKRFDVEVTGMDFAEEMIHAANVLKANQPLKGSLQFRVGDLVEYAPKEEPLDLIYTERTLINLQDWDAQRQAIMDIGKLLVEGGLYVMCENSQDGLDRINMLRLQVGLEEIRPPWHNRYFRDEELNATNFAPLVLERISHYSSTYYFVSRVMNAWLAAREGKEPDYDAPINKIALQLGPIGEFGQGRIWLWRKSGVEAKEA